MKDINEFKSLGGLKRYRAALQRKISGLTQEHTEVCDLLRELEGKEAHICALLDADEGDMLAIARKAQVSLKAVQLVETARRGQERRVSSMRGAHAERFAKRVAQYKAAPRWHGFTAYEFSQHMGITLNMARRVIQAAKGDADAA